MNVLIVHAHPEAQSFNAALMRHAVQVLQTEGHAVQVSDLYAMHFDPVSSRSNFTTVRNPGFLKLQAEEAYAAGAGGFSPDVQAEMEKVTWCGCLIFQFPLWWFSLPAILKGWVDRVFASGFAYGGGRVYENGMLRGRRAMLSITTGGGEEAYRADGMHGALERSLYPIHHGVFAFTGMDVLPPFVAYSAARLDDEQRRALLEQYAARLRALESTPPLRFKPQTVDFDL